MKIKEEINNIQKEDVFDTYTRVIENFKNYNKISRSKMIDEICREYSNYQNIIDICVTREMKLLEKIIKNNNEYRFLDCERWEVKTLYNKYLLIHYIDNDSDKNVCIPEELIDYVILALKNVNWKELEEKTEMTEVIAGFCKAYGIVAMDAVLEVMPMLLDKSKKDIYEYIMNYKNMKYYIYTTLDKIDRLDYSYLSLKYQDYYDLYDDICDRRKELGCAAVSDMNVETYKSMFYNQININNEKVGKLYNIINMVEKSDSIINSIEAASILQDNYDIVKTKLRVYTNFKEETIQEILELLKEAMDEIPSPSLNGATPKDYKKWLEQKKKIEIEKKKNYVKQINAFIDKKDADLFYDLFFAVLEYTNDNYKINQNITKIYKQKFLNPKALTKIIDFFCLDADKIINDFTKENKYNFNKEQLKIINEWKSVKRGSFIITKYEEDYAEFYDDEKIYMVKGVRCNIDQIIPYDNIPCIVETALLPFKGKIIYDGILEKTNISIGSGIIKHLNESSKNKIKYYHL